MSRSDGDPVRAALLIQRLALDNLAKEVNLVLDEPTRHGLEMLLADVNAATEEANEAMKAEHQPMEATSEHA